MKTDRLRFLIDNAVTLIHQEKLNSLCNTGGNESFTIEFLFDDYVEHLEYHLRQIVILD